jgi:hypothetical protein
VNLGIKRHYTIGDWRTILGTDADLPRHRDEVSDSHTLAVWSGGARQATPVVCTALRHLYFSVHRAMTALHVRVQMLRSNSGIKSSSSSRSSGTCATAKAGEFDSLDLRHREM